MLVKVSLVLFVLFVGVASFVKTTCPGGRQQCPDDSTCCEMNSSSSYGCCPLPNAVCCSDKFHCCPANTRCDDESRSCLASNGTVFAATKKVRKSKTQIIVPEITSIDNIENYRKAIYGSVICPDEVSECPEANTCCELEDGSYGCCPMEEAECCSDHIHCCPNGSTCNVEEGTCLNRFGLTFPASKKTPSMLLSKRKLFFLKKAGLVESSFYDEEYDLIKCGANTVCFSDERCCRKNEKMTCCPKNTQL